MNYLLTCGSFLGESKTTWRRACADGSYPRPGPSPGRKVTTDHVSHIRLQRQTDGVLRTPGHSDHRPAGRCKKPAGPDHSVKQLCWPNNPSRPGLARWDCDEGICSLGQTGRIGCAYAACGAASNTVNQIALPHAPREVSGAFYLL